MPQVSIDAQRVEGRSEHQIEGLIDAVRREIGRSLDDWVR